MYARILEIVLLTFLFTFIMFYFDVHGWSSILANLLNHGIALGIAILISQTIFWWFQKN